MDNTQVEVYKFKMSYIKDFFVDLFGNSNSENDELIEKEVEEIRKQENPEYIKKLEKEMENHEISTRKAKNKIEIGNEKSERDSKAIKKNKDDKLEEKEI